MSHVAIAAALALENPSAGERLAAFSLASFANRDHRAWPGTRVAAARAGLSRSQYLAARDGLERRGLIAVEEPGGGRGHSPVMRLRFAHSGPWREGQINAELFEATLGYSRARGSARLLLATLAALADEQFEVGGIATVDLRAAAGIADSTYRRARAALLTSGELVLDAAGGGRARTNRWLLRDPRKTAGAEPVLARRTRVAPGRADRPLVAAAKESLTVQAVGEQLAADGGREVVKGPGLNGVSDQNPGQIRTVYAEKGPGLSGVFELNPAQCRTASPETRPQTPPKTPPPIARAVREPKNPRTIPPSPPDGGSSPRSVSIVENYVTDRGRKRQRTVVVALKAIREKLRHPTDVDLADWDLIRAELRRAVGESMFEIWLAHLQLAATDHDGCLILAAPPATRSWIAKRYGRLLQQTGPSTAGRQLRLATERELQLIEGLGAAHPPTLLTDPSTDHQEAV